jgi:hypothetical protein
MEKIREFKIKTTQIDEDVAKISKDEFTVFRVNNGAKEINKLYIQGRYDVDYDEDKIG